MRHRTLSSHRAAALLALLGLAPPAWAYLDPSTGSMILSAIVGILATVGLAVKTYWYRLKNLLRGQRRTGAGQSPQPEPPAAGSSGDAGRDSSRHP